MVMVVMQAVRMSEQLHSGTADGVRSRLAAASQLQAVPERACTGHGHALGDALESNNTEEAMLSGSGSDRDAPARSPKQEALQGKRTSSSLTEALLAAEDPLSSAQDDSAQVLACTATSACCVDNASPPVQRVCVCRHTRHSLWACRGRWTGRSTGALWAHHLRHSRTCQRACTSLWKVAETACLELLAGPWCGTPHCESMKM